MGSPRPDQSGRRIHRNACTAPAGRGDRPKHWKTRGTEDSGRRPEVSLATSQTYSSGIVSLSDRFFGSGLPRTTSAGIPSLVHDEITGAGRSSADSGPHLPVMRHRFRVDLVAGQVDTKMDRSAQGAGGSRREVFRCGRPQTDPIAFAGGRASLDLLLSPGNAEDNRRVRPRSREAPEPGPQCPVGRGVPRDELTSFHCRIGDERDRRIEIGRETSHHAGFGTRMHSASAGRPPNAQTPRATQHGCAPVSDDQDARWFEDS